MSHLTSVSQTADANPLPGVPLVESPFFDRFFNEANTEPALLSIARQMRDVGFAVFDFPDPEFEQLADGIINDLGTYWDDASIPRQSIQEDQTRIQDAWQFNEAVQRLATNPRILELLKALYGRQGWPFQTLNFRYGSQQHHHTDIVHFSSIPERFMCGVWVALEDIVLEAGPLVYYPGSHRWPIYANEHIGYTLKIGDKPTQALYHELWESLVTLNGTKPQQFLAKKGQALLWAANLLHGGAPRINPQVTRWSQVTHYYFEGCTYVTPMLSDPVQGVCFYRQPSNLLTAACVPLPSYEPDVARPIPEALFDAKAYLIANPDVQQAGVDAYTHYVAHGFKEGRCLS